MAAPLICDLDPSHGEADFLVTFLGPAEAKALCAACFARLGLETAINTLPADEVLGRTQRPLEAPVNGETPPAPPAGRKRASTTPAKRRRATQALEGVAETAPADPDR